MSAGYVSRQLFAYILTITSLECEDILLLLFTAWCTANKCLEII